MKTILMMFAVLSFALVATTGAIAQSGSKSQSTAHVCQKCDMAYAKAGKCACGSETMKASGRVAYVCSHCNTSSSKAANCKKCNMATKKSFVTYACEACKVTSKKPGDCKMCKGALKKHVIPMM
jgi:hypothetical protein